MPDKEVKACYPDEQEQRIGTPILGEADVVSHKGEGKSAWEGDCWRELSAQEIDHRDRENSKD